MTSLKDSIEGLWKEYASAVVAKDLKRWMTLWIEEGIQLPPNAPENVGKKQIEAFGKILMESIPVTNMLVTSKEVRETSDWGFSRGNYWLKITPKEGE